MPRFDVEKEPIYVFELKESYVFKHYFERQDLFSELSDYYDDEEYRFEVPADEFRAVRELLGQNYFEPKLVDDYAAFAVVKEAYTEHADILRNSVLSWTREGYNFFIMKDPGAVEQAVERGATRIDETDLVLAL